MLREFSNNLELPGKRFYISDPYFKVRIDSFDNPDVCIRDDMAAFTADNPTTTSYGRMTGMMHNATSTHMHFTRQIETDSYGYTMIRVFVQKTPKATGDIEIYYDGTLVHSESGYNSWDDRGTWITTPIFESYGDAQIEIVLPKFTYGGAFEYKTITRYEGGRDLRKEDAFRRLDIKSIEFTKNGVNEVDSATITVVMKDYYYDMENPYSTLVFDLGDMVTIWLGEDRQHTIPMFGGYVEGWELNGNELKINCVDRLWDMARTYITKNFSIGYLPNDSTSSNMPFTQFPNVNEIARYLCTTDYSVNFNAITRDYIFYNNFATTSDLGTFTVSGYEVTHEADFGNPSPCIKVRPNILGESYITIYNSSDGLWDAAKYNYFNFDYYVSGGGVKYPVEFNIEIDMYKSGALPSTALTYTILFNGDTDAEKIIGNVQPLYDGTWQHFTVDLKALFDKAAPSSEYLIKAVRIIGTPDEEVILNKKCSSIYIDHIMAYRDFQSAPRYKSADKKTALGELQDLCAQTNHVAFIRAGEERRDDQLILLPKRFYTLPVKIDGDVNVLSVDSLQYKPLDWGITNYANNSYTYNNTTGYSIKQDNDSIKRYGVIESHEALSDVETPQDADTKTQMTITEKAVMYPSFDVDIQGTTLVEPGQMIMFDIPKYRLYGSQEVKSISFNIDAVNMRFTTQIGLGQPNRQYLQYVRDILKAQMDLKTVKNTLTYQLMANQAAGLSTSTGAMTNF